MTVFTEWLPILPAPTASDAKARSGFTRLSDGGSASIGSFITGAITQADSVAGPHTVLVYSRNGWSRGPIAAVQSGVGGTWQLDGLKAGNYYMAIIQDRSRTLNAAVLDWMQATTPPP